MALWIFYLFELQIAFPLWVVGYLFINLFFKNNAIIKSAYAIDSHYVMRQFEKGILIHKNLWQIKNYIVSSCIKKYSLKPINIYLKYRTSFGVGLLISVLRILINDYFITNYQFSKNTYDVLLENIILLTMILYYSHKIAYKICVQNVNGKWFDNKKIFNMYFFLHCIVYYIIVIAISLG